MRSCRFFFGAAVLALLMSGCGDGDRSSHSPEPEAAIPEAEDIASADPQLKYFHEQLIVDGEDVQSAFGGYLLTLGMHARDLQQDEPRHAYTTVLDKVRTVEDPALRREMMRTFFNISDSQ